MNGEQVRRNVRLREMLASEYTLGTLRGGALRRFEKWLCADAALRACVAQWQDRLQAMAELAPAATPSPHVWQSIERQLVDHSGRRGTPTARTFFHTLFVSLRFWRSIALASSAIATLLVAALVGKALLPVALPMTYIATLTDNQSRISAVIVGDPARGKMTVKVLAPKLGGKDKSMELWALPENGTPRSLGLVTGNETVVLPLPRNVTPESMPALAVSLEPQGGSPDPGGPTGPILFQGAWGRM